jgi:outer membrane protein assembly factor BamB
MNGFRKKFAASVKVSDQLGNQKEEKFDIPVTRWKWHYKYINQNAWETPIPAIGTNGDVYVGKYAFTPDLKDEKPKSNPDSQIQSVQSIAVGKNILGAERIFILGTENTAASGKLWEVDPDKLSERELCSGGVPVGNIALSAISYQGIAGPIPTIFVGFRGLASIDGSQVVGAKLLEEVDCGRVASLAPSGGLVARGQSLFFGTDEGPSIVRQEQVNGGWSESWSTKTSVSPQGLVATDANLLGNLSNSRLAENNKIARINAPYSSDSTLIELETKNLISNLIVVKIGEENRVIYLHRNLTETEVLSIPENFETITRPERISTIPGIVWSAPIVGEDKTLYVVAENSTLYAINLNKTIIWQVKIGDDISLSLGKNYTLAMDCNRDQNRVTNRPGVLYLSSNNGVTAVVVDSKGIDTTSPWPKIGRDPRNTFDSTLNLEEFNCKSLASK